MGFLRPGRDPGIFPLSVRGTYFIQANGLPFLIHGDTPWMMPNQLTNAQIDTYLATRASQGFTAILFEAPGWRFTSQTPAYNNVDGVAPFTSTGQATCTFESMVSAYWNRVDYIVDEAKKKGIVCFIAHAYLGFGGGSGTTADEGCNVQLGAATQANRQAYGAALAARYTQGNVVWVHGGDYATPSIATVWDVATGIRTVRTTDFHTYHAARQSEGTTTAGAMPGFNLNTTYCLKDGSDSYSLSATAYARGIPHVLMEAGYEGEATLQEMRRAAYGAYLSGACGHFYGNNPIWGFGEPVLDGGAGAAASLTSLTSTGAQQMSYLKGLMTAYKWWLLVPKTDTSLVTTSLGSGTTRILPARASDGSFAMVFTPTANFTVDMTAFTGTVRGRWFDVATGAFTAASGSPFTNTGTQAFTAPGEVVLVLDT